VKDVDFLTSGVGRPPACATINRDYDEKQNFGRARVKTGNTSASVEQFTITLAKSGNGVALKMEWENTSASAEFQVK
jgi:Protein of unknown function (DUF2911)